MSVDLVESRIELAVDLAHRAVRRDDFVAATRYFRSADTLEFIKEIPHKQSLLVNDLQSIRLANSPVGHASAQAYNKAAAGKRR